MLTQKQIEDAINNAVPAFCIKSAAYFGSYAKAAQTETSDLDLIVEFTEPAVSLITLSALKDQLENELRVPVDIVHGPVTDSAYFDIGETVQIYG
jgi:predicted nucleotidyltransferase